MPEDAQTEARRSTRLAISIPVVISGTDVDGKEFRENVRTLVVNKHGGKISMVRHLALGSEITVENLTLHAVAKANVVWLSDRHYPGEMHHVGLQLLQAQNVWGIAFPPDDWSLDAQAEAAVAAANSLQAEKIQTNPLAAEETIRLLQEFQRSADGHLRDFEQRLKELAQRVGAELEVELRERAACAQARELGALQPAIQTLNETLAASRQEIGELQDAVQELRGNLLAASASAGATTPLQEARRQLAALANSVVESMNTAAQAGLNEYRNLLRRENQANAEQRRPGAEGRPESPKSAVS